MADQDLKSTVRSAYGKIALETADACCGDDCCSDSGAQAAATATAACCGSGCCGGVSQSIGYSAEELASLPEGADLGLGCGNPLALASIREGDVVLDLGSGAGIDCFLAAKAAGPAGRAIGVDMTPEMLARARANAEKAGIANVEFREGELEALPVDDATIDLVISNCVINLVPDRDRVYAEAFRVLKPGGRISVADTIQTVALPEAFLAHEIAKSACISAQVTKDAYLASLTNAGFLNVAIEREAPYPADLGFEERLLEGLRDEQGIPEDVIRAAARSLVSIAVTARKPG